VILNPARRHAICGAIAATLVAQLAPGPARPARSRGARRASTRRPRAG
jgi:hypothetical protein